MDAVLMLFVSLAQGVRTTLGIWRRIGKRDWHMQSDTSALPQATSGIPSQEPNTTRGYILGRLPGISAGAPKGLGGALSMSSLSEAGGGGSRVLHARDGAGSLHAGILRLT